MLELLLIAFGQGFFTPTIGNSTQVVVGKEINIIADHDTKDILNFNLYIDNQVQNPRTTPVFQYTFTTVGQHSIVISAVSKETEVRSQPLFVNVIPNTCSFTPIGSSTAVEYPKGHKLSGNNAIDPNSISDRNKITDKLKELINGRWTVLSFPDQSAKRFLILAWC